MKSPDDTLLFLMQNHLHRSNKNDRFFYDSASQQYGEYETVEAAKKVAETNRLIDPEYHQALNDMLAAEPYHRQSFYLYSRNDVLSYKDLPDDIFSKTL